MRSTNLRVCIQRTPLIRTYQQIVRTSLIRSSLHYPGYTGSLSLDCYKETRKLLVNVRVTMKCRTWMWLGRKVFYFKEEECEIDRIVCEEGDNLKLLGLTNGETSITVPVKDVTALVFPKLQLEELPYEARFFDVWDGASSPPGGVAVALNHLIYAGVVVEIALENGDVAYAQVLKVCGKGMFTGRYLYTSEEVAKLCMNETPSYNGKVLFLSDHMCRHEVACINKVVDVSPQLFYRRNSDEFIVPYFFDRARMTLRPINLDVCKEWIAIQDSYRFTSAGICYDLHGHTCTTLLSNIITLFTNRKARLSAAPLNKARRFPFNFISFAMLERTLLNQVKVEEVVARDKRRFNVFRLEVDPDDLVVDLGKHLSHIDVRGDVLSILGKVILDYCLDRPNTLDITFTHLKLEKASGALLYELGNVLSEVPIHAPTHPSMDNQNHVESVEKPTGEESEGYVPGYL